MLYNKITKKVIINKTKFAVNFFSQLKGLMFESRKNFDYALVFVLPKESVLAATIHTFFVFFPIDVVFLNKEKKVMEIAESVKPFIPIHAPKKPSKYFVELPEGKAKSIKVGDILDWKN